MRVCLCVKVAGVVRVVRGYLGGCLGGRQDRLVPPRLEVPAPRCPAPHPAPLCSADGLTVRRQANTGHAYAFLSVERREGGGGVYRLPSLFVTANAWLWPVCAGTA